MAVFINTKKKGKTMKEIRSVICLNCRRTALVKLLPYGRGKVGVCPLCNGVAYNSTGTKHTTAVSISGKNKKKHNT